MSLTMHRPNDREWLAIWEESAGQPPVERAIVLLSACCGASREEIARLSIAARDRGLFAIHQLCFGPILDAFAQCPACGDALEYSLRIDDFTTQSGGELPLQVEKDGVSVAIRLPNSIDLRAVSNCGDLGRAGRILLERCVVSAKVDEVDVPAETLSADVIDAISSRLAAADPLAEVLIDLTCIACRHQWQVLLDVERFLWAKITALAKRLLLEVHALASAYGWTEREILSLGHARRRKYLEMAWQTS
jgi:hypothetical protein